jgi:hypothetical protein
LLSSHFWYWASWPLEAAIMTRRGGSAGADLDKLANGIATKSVTRIRKAGMAASKAGKRRAE